MGPEQRPTPLDRGCQPPSPGPFGVPHLAGVLPRAAAAAVTSAVLAAGCSYTTPDVSPAPPVNAQSTTVLAADGSVLTRLDGGEHRIEVGWQDIPRHLADAVVAIEDRRFWNHVGIDLQAIVRAARTNVEAGDIVEGGSTITQQYVKSAFLRRDRTLDRKIEEASLAIQLERSHTKEEILTYYLNTVYLGAGAYGIGAAADTYFGKPVPELSLAEAALLAGLIRTPSADEPFSNPDGALDRRGEVLDAMAAQGWIDEGTRDAADSEPLGLTTGALQDTTTAPYFVDAVERWALERPELGATPQERALALYSGGLRIETTLDPALQAEAEQAVERVLPEAGDPDAALVVLQPGTGEVKAWVGGRDYDGQGPHAKFDLVGLARRPAGSVFKPMVLATALEQGVPLGREYSAPAHLELAVTGGTWEVENYDGIEGGVVDLADATVFSLNTAYAALVTDVGPDGVVHTAARLGVDSPLEAVPSITLGSQDVSPLDIAASYTALASDGIHHEPALVSRITDADGSVLYEHRPDPVEAVSPATAHTVTDVLRQVIERGTGYRARIGRPAAGKTGTSQDWADAWFAGYTPDLVAVVWVGFAESRVPMVPPRTRETVTGGSWPARIWQLFMTAALAERPAAEFPPPPEPVAGESGTDEAVAYVGPTVPDVLGLPVDVAVDQVTRAGFVAVTVEVPDDQYPAGVVVASQPAVGSRSPGGSVVTISVADGTSVVRVPSLLGLSGTEASTLAGRAGYAVEVEVLADPDDVAATAGAGRVWQQEPPSGAPLEAGGTVTVQVNPPTQSGR